MELSAGRTLVLRPRAQRDRGAMPPFGVLQSPSFLSIAMVTPMRAGRLKVSQAMSNPSKSPERRLCRNGAADATWRRVLC